MAKSHKLSEEEFKVTGELLRELVWCIGQAGFRGKVALKGALALYDISLENDQTGYRRGTQDIDLDIKSEDEYRRLFDNIVTISNSNRYGVVYEECYRRPFNNGSAGISISGVYKGISCILSVDMNIKEFYPIEVIDISGIDEIERYTDVAMLVTKIKVACSPTIRRRAKDMYDIATLCTKRDFLFSEIVRVFEVKYPGEVFKLRSFVISSNYEVLRKAIEGNHQFNGIDYPALFSLVYNFLNPFTACARDYHAQYEYKWFHETRIWTAI